MGWFSSVSNGLSTLGSGFVGGAQWIWQNANPVRLVWGVGSYTFNTGFQMVEQLLAVREAAPTLKNNPQAAKIATGIAQVVVDDILPLVSLNYANNCVQQYFRDGYNDDSWYASAAPYLSALALAYYTYLAYSKNARKHSYMEQAKKDNKLLELAQEKNNSNSKELVQKKTDSNVLFHLMEFGLNALPLVPLIYINNNALPLVRNGYGQDASWFAPYSLFLTGLTAVKYVVNSYTWRQGVETTLKIAMLDSMGPGAFNSNKKTLPPSVCDQLECNFKRKIKGWGREPWILLGNDLLTFGISKIPYVGETASKVLSVYFNGRYILRVTTPELCERHKFERISQETTLALGAGYFATTWLMDKTLESTVGIPPFLYYRALKHLLLLMHINVAAHLTFKQIDPKDASSSIDPLTLYERINRFIVDVFFDGLMKRIPIDFKPDPMAPPLIPLSHALKFGTMLLNSDVKKETKSSSGFFSQAKEKALVMVLPPMLRSWDGFTSDPIIVMYWPSVKNGVITVLDFVEKYGKDRRVKTLAWMPKTTAEVINLKFGFPKKVTRFVLMLSREEDFWNLMMAIKLWFLRHSGIQNEVKVEEMEDIPSILGERQLVELPDQDDNKKPVMPPEQLVQSPGDNSILSVEEISQAELRSAKVFIDPDDLLPKTKTKQRLTLFDVDPSQLEVKADRGIKSDTLVKRKPVIEFDPDQMFFRASQTDDREPSSGPRVLNLGSL